MVDLLLVLDILVHLLGVLLHNISSLIMVNMVILVHDPMVHKYLLFHLPPPFIQMVTLLT